MIFFFFFSKSRFKESIGDALTLPSLILINHYAPFGVGLVTIYQVVVSLNYLTSRT